MSLAITALQVGTGLFFACSGYNKLTDKQRHASLVHTLEEDKVPAVKVMQWWVPGWELVAGGMLAMHLFSQFAALVLLIIMLVALYVEGRKRVAEYKPINLPDVICDWLYLPEMVYALVLLVLMVR